MVRGNKRSRTFRRIYVKTPGGKVKMQYKRRKPDYAKCSCGARLMGVPRNIPAKIRKFSKSERRPERPYGGSLCSKCMRMKIKAASQ